MKNKYENVKFAIETAIGGRKNLEHEDYKKIGIDEEELKILETIYIYRQYQIAIIADVLMSKEKEITEISLATTVDAQKPFIKLNGKCAYLYIRWKVPKEKNNAWHWEGNCPPFFFYIITKCHPLLLYIRKCFVLLLYKGLRLIWHTNLIR